MNVPLMYSPGLTIGRLQASQKEPIFIKDLSLNQSLWLYKSYYFVMSVLHLENRVEVMTFHSDEKGMVTNFKEIACADDSHDVKLLTVRKLDGAE